jgi:hypothetical protein
MVTATVEAAANKSTIGPPATNTFSILLAGVIPRFPAETEKYLIADRSNAEI